MYTMSATPKHEQEKQHQHQQEQESTKMSPTSSMDSPTVYQTHHNRRTNTTRYLLLLASSNTLTWCETPGHIPAPAHTLTHQPQHALQVPDFFPAYDPYTMQKYDPDSASDSPAPYHKQQGVLRSDAYLTDPSRFAILTLNELRVCETLRQHPHANMATYLGCATTLFGDGAERVTALVYARYDMTLAEYADAELLDMDEIPFLLAGVEGAMKHLHRLGIVHCDLQPRNVFLKVRAGGEGKKVAESVVLGDFDSALREGELIELKHATRFWWPEEVGYGDVARRAIDEYSFRQLRPWMVTRAAE